MSNSLQNHIGFCILGCVSLGFVTLVVAAEPKADVPPTAKRTGTVEVSARHARAVEPKPVSADIKSPFNPPGFDDADIEELKAKAAALAATSDPAKPLGDRDILEKVAARIPPSGTFILGGEPILLIGQKKLKVGDQITIGFDNRDYLIEITAITRTTYSLRLNQAEITRPIKSGKNP